MFIDDPLKTILIVTAGITVFLDYTKQKMKKKTQRILDSIEFAFMVATFLILLEKVIK